MKRSSRGIRHVIFTMILILYGCGDELVSGMKDFTPNTPPRITGFTFTVPEGQDTEIHPSMRFDLTVTAADADDDEIRYTFTSGYGSFTGMEPTDNGCTVSFFMGNTCPAAGSQGIPVTVTATDGRAGSDSRTIYPGGAVEGLAITSNLADGALPSGGQYTFNFSVNCSGYYQVRHTPSGDTGPVTYDGRNCYPYNRNAAVGMTIGAGTGYNDNTSYYLPAASGTYRVYVIFCDNFTRQEQVSALITVE